MNRLFATLLALLLVAAVAAFGWNKFKHVILSPVSIQVQNEQWIADSFQILRNS